MKSLRLGRGIEAINPVGVVLFEGQGKGTINRIQS